MSTPEQPASDAAKPSDEAVKAAEALSPLFMDNGEERNAGHIIDRETNLPELKASLAYLGPLMPVLEAREAKALKKLAFVQAQLAAQQAALSAAKDALERAVAIINGEFGYTFQESAEWLFDQTGRKYVVNDDPESIAAEKERIEKAHAALAQIRARGNT